MIIAKTPFCVSFAGGGSDMAEFYRERGGCVLSTIFFHGKLIQGKNKFRIVVWYLLYKEDFSLGNEENLAPVRGNR